LERLGRHQCQVIGLYIAPLFWNSFNKSLIRIRKAMFYIFSFSAFKQGVGIPGLYQGGIVPGQGG